MGSRAGDAAQREKTSPPVSQETLTEGGQFADFTSSSGVTLRIRPYSLRFYRELQEAAFERFPSVEEEEKEQRIEAERNQWLGEKLLAFLLDFCVELDLEAWEPTIRRLEGYAEAYPEDPFDRKVRFLSDYAVRTEGEYTKILTLSLKLARGDG